MHFTFLVFLHLHINKYDDNKYVVIICCKHVLYYDDFNSVPLNRKDRYRMKERKRGTNFNRYLFLLPVIYMRHFEIRHSEFDASALRFKRCGPLSRDRSGPYTTQKLNLLTGETDKLFRGPW